MQPVDAVQDGDQRPKNAEYHLFKLGVRPFLHHLIGNQDTNEIDYQF